MGPEDGWTAVTVRGAFLAGILLVAAFVLVGGWGAAQFLITLHLQDTLGWSPLATAAELVIGP